MPSAIAARVTDERRMDGGYSPGSSIPTSDDETIIREGNRMEANWRQRGRIMAPFNNGEKYCVWPS